MLNNKIKKHNYMSEIKEARSRIRWIHEHDLYDTHEEQLQFLEARVEELGQKLAALD